MTDKHELLILPNHGDSSIVLSEASSSIVARGREDAGSLMVRKSEPRLLSAFKSLLALGGLREKSGFADRGDAIVQFGMGCDYFFGEGVPQDFPQAAIWFRKAAEQGHTGAQINLGTAYSRGLGVPQD